MCLGKPSIVDKFLKQLEFHCNKHLCLYAKLFLTYCIAFQRGKESGNLDDHNSWPFAGPQITRPAQN